jgi:D-amino-acid dehydrogenase
MSKKVAVIGAGIAGITAAYYLAKEGYSVTVFEQERYTAMRTSFANGGQVSVSNSEVWTTWGNVKKGIKWMFKKDAPLLIRPRLDWAQWRWMAKFLWNTAKGDYARNTAETIRLGLEARSLYTEIIREEGLNFDQSACGILHFYKDDKYFQNAVDVKDLYNANGCEWDLLSPMKTKSMDPALGSIKGIVGGAWTPSDWTGDIHKFCHEMERVLTHKYGVEFRYMDMIQSAYDFEILDDCYDAVVVAAGVGSEKLANIVGDSLGIYPVKGYSITITVNDITSYEAMPKVSLLDDQAKIVTSTLGNRLRVAGTAELAGENYDIRKDRIQPLLDWVHTNFPNIDTRDYTQWACLRPMTSNMMPVVRQSKKNPKIFYHAGHGHLGWTLSPATAKQLCKIMETIKC